MFSEFIPALKLTLLTFVLCGLAYPLLTTGLAQSLFPRQANGSLIPAGKGKPPFGSALIGQEFTGPQWFRPRSSAIGYKAEASGASNDGPTNKALLERVASEAAVVRAENPTIGDKPIPVDLLTTSGSGLDPDISIASARLQAARVAKARRLSEDAVLALIDAHTEGRDLGLFGEPRVNVLELNLALANAEPSRASGG
ncbi:MAG: potassium-transporting ATPase subunit KdpC [Cyanobacteria bacterium REEB65]|nr:potassium-transporting ATPase subunit KdpC [Cyanobacteria bacterium REEB65]